MALKKIPDLSKTDSFKSASNLVCVLELKTFKDMPVEKKVETLENIIIAHHKTLVEFGIYNENIYARYKAAARKVEILRKEFGPRPTIGRPRKKA